MEKKQVFGNITMKMVSYGMRRHIKMVKEMV